MRLSGVVGDVWAGGGRPGWGRRVVTPPLVVVRCQPTPLAAVNTGQGAGGQLRSTHHQDLRRDVTGGETGGGEFGKGKVRRVF